MPNHTIELGFASECHAELIKKSYIELYLHQSNYKAPHYENGCLNLHFPSPEDAVNFSFALTKKCQDFIVTSKNQIIAFFENGVLHRFSGEEATQNDLLLLLTPTSLSGELIDYFKPQNHTHHINFLEDILSPKKEEDQNDPNSLSASNYYLSLIAAYKNNLQHVLDELATINKQPNDLSPSFQKKINQYHQLVNDSIHEFFEKCPLSYQELLDFQKRFVDLIHNINNELDEVRQDSPSKDSTKNTIGQVLLQLFLKVIQYIKLAINYLKTILFVQEKKLNSDGFFNSTDKIMSQKIKHRLNDIRQQQEDVYEKLCKELQLADRLLIAPAENHVKK